MPAAKKPKVGRPSLSGKGAAAYVQIKLAPETSEAWRAAAEKQGQTLSEWLREAGDLAVARGSTR